ncbi:MAG: DUF885 domain-containing protein [Gemmatimonadetes bacterium]|nr:DUF885 domain-containing protein [Gemmatimonadota bacterium]
MRVRRPLSLVAMLALAACASGPSKEWDTFVHDYLEASYAADPAFAVGLGRHEFDGRLADLSTGALLNEINRQRDSRARALAFDSTKLSPEQRFERAYLVAVIDGSLFWTQAAQWPWRNPQFYAAELDPQVYITRDYAPIETRMKALTSWARAIPQAVSQVKGNLALPLPPSYAAIGRVQFGGLASFLETDVKTAFAPVKDSALRADFTGALAGAVKAFKDMDAWFAAQEKHATGKFAMGPELFEQMVRVTEMVDVPLDRLEAIGRADLERNLNTLKVVCETYASGQSLRQCVDKAGAKKPDGGILEGARKQLPMLEEFIRTQHIASIPDTDQALVRESPPYMRWNFAFMNTRGLFEQGLPSIYYVSPPDPTWTKAKQDGYVPGAGTLLATSVHEVWPGHFLQFLHATHVPSQIGRIYGSYAFVEGWAHYSEEMMWDAGLGGGDPALKIGQLGDALLRNVRFVCAIGMHAKGMTVKECERLFLEQGLQDPATAEQQAARGTFDPAYLNYTLGKLMIMKLREEWTASRGGRAAWGQFHDALLSYGGPPVPLIRRAMLGPNAGPPL